MGASAFKLLEPLADTVEGCVVEIGSQRNEGSTEYFAGLFGTSRPVHTVDFDPNAFNRVKNIPNVRAHWMKGEDFLENYAEPEQIGLLYLDNFDWIYAHIAEQPWLLAQVERYRVLGSDMNNINSQLAHLMQSQLALPHMSATCYVLFDDTWQLDDGTYDGKGGTAVPCLLENGFVVIQQSPKLPQGRKETLSGFVLLVRKSEDS